MIAFSASINSMTITSTANSTTFFTRIAASVSEILTNTIFITMRNRLIGTPIATAL